MKKHFQYYTVFHLDKHILQVYNLLFSGTVMLSVTRKEEQYLNQR